MKALPPAPEQRLIDGKVYEIGVDLASVPDITVVQKWFEDGRYECWIGGKLVHSNHIHERPPFVRFNV